MKEGTLSSLSFNLPHSGTEGLMHRLEGVLVTSIDVLHQASHVGVLGRLTLVVVCCQDRRRLTEGGMAEVQIHVVTFKNAAVNVRQQGHDSAPAHQPETQPFCPADSGQPVRVRGA